MKRIKEPSIVKFSILFSLLTTFCFADDVEKEVNSSLGLRIYSVKSLEKKLARIEQQFPAVSLCTDSSMRKELYAFTNRSADSKNCFSDGFGTVIGRNAPIADSAFMANLDRSEPAPALHTYPRAGTVCRIGAITFGAGAGISLFGFFAFLGESFGDAPEDPGLPNPGDTTSAAASADKRSSPVSLTKVLLTTGGILAAGGLSTVIVSFPLAIHQNHRSENQRLNLIAQHNRNRIVKSIRIQLGK